MSTYSDIKSRKGLTEVTDVTFNATCLSFNAGNNRIRLSVVSTPDAHKAKYLSMQETIQEKGKGTILLDSTALHAMRYAPQGKKTIEVPALAAAVAVLGPNDTALALYGSSFVASEVKTANAKTASKLAALDSFLNG
jgi:hypothetical protein